MSRAEDGVVVERARAQQLGWLTAGLCLMSPLLIGGAPAWSLTLICLMSLYTLVALLRGGLYLRSWRGLAFAGYGVSILGALISLIPLSPHSLSVLSPEISELWARLSQLLSAEGGAPAAWTLSLSPVETCSWLCLELTCLCAAYVSCHLHRARRPLLISLALLGPLLTLLGAAHMALDLSEIYGLYHSLDRSAIKGFYTPVINKNSAASLMTLSAISSLGVGLHYAQLRRAQRLEQGRSERVIWPWLLSPALSALGVVACASRAALLMMMIGCCLVLYRARDALIEGVRRGWWGLGLMAGVLLYMGSEWESVRAAMLAEQPEGASHLAEAHSYPRFLVWRDCLPYLERFGLWGTGRGSFGELYMSLQSFGSRMWISHPESHILQQLTEGGLIGLAGGILLPFSAWLIWWRRSLNQAHLSAFGLWVALGAVAAHQLFDFGFEYAGLSVPVAVAWGALWSYLPAREAQREASQRVQSRGRRLQQSCLIASLVALSCLAHYSYTRAGLKLREAVVKTRLSASDDQADLKRLASHPTSAHIAVEVLLKRASAWLTSSQDALSEAQRTSLVRWLGYAKQRGPQLSTVYQVEARLLRADGLKQLAGVSYVKAMRQAPWRFKELSAELIQVAPVAPELLPKALQAPYMRTLRASLGEAALLRLLTSQPEAWFTELAARPTPPLIGALQLNAVIRAELMRSCAQLKQKERKLLSFCLGALSDMERRLASWAAEGEALKGYDELTSWAQLDSLSAGCLSARLSLLEGAASPEGSAAQPLKWPAPLSAADQKRLATRARKWRLNGACSHRLERD